MSLKKLQQEIEVTIYSINSREVSDCIDRIKSMCISVNFSNNFCELL